MKNAAVEVAPCVNINATAQTSVDNVTYWPLDYRETGEFRERMAENPAGRLTEAACRRQVRHLRRTFDGTSTSSAMGASPSMARRAGRSTAR
jgi:hypothetical protein